MTAQEPQHFHSVSINTRRDRSTMLRLLSREDLLANLLDQDSLNEKKHSSSLSEQSSSSTATMEQHYEYDEEEGSRSLFELSPEIDEPTQASSDIQVPISGTYHRNMTVDDRIRLADIKLAQDRAAKKLIPLDPNKRKRKSPKVSTSKAVKSKSKAPKC